MQTNFTLLQLANPEMAEINSILRSCVHCGFCIATCPTYKLLGDEADSPRGRIYQIKDMLERDIAAPQETVKHVDRCLSCLSCMTTCPSSVHYMHLVDYARTHIQKTYKRPLLERVIRECLIFILPIPLFFRLALILSALVKPLVRFMPRAISAIFSIAPTNIPAPSWVDRPQSFPAYGERRGRVILMKNCAQQVLAPEINESTIRLLSRIGYEVVVVSGAKCCGALAHHLGKSSKSRHQAEANILAWSREINKEPVDAVIINASGCGTVVKDYGFMFRNDEVIKEKADKIAANSKDITEFLVSIDLSNVISRIPLKVAYHSACSMQHGQKVKNDPIRLLEAAGFLIEIPDEEHFCCGSAGIYNLLQPKIAGELRARKVANIEATEPDVVATGNIGCITQIANATQIPVVHTVELLDWATGGPRPKRLSQGKVENLVNLCDENSIN